MAAEIIILIQREIVDTGRLGVQIEVLVARMAIASKTIRFRKAIKKASNALDNILKQSFYKSADTFILLAFESLHPHYIRDVPLTDIFYTKSVGILYTTDTDYF